MNQYICVHGHFYQPPRENPWLEEIELQDSASPYHDWNERITAECYAPNAAARILENHRDISEIVNNYSKISFNFGPTLLAWLERRAPGVYQAIIDADSESRRRFSGHGAAIAQVYSHLIMPLANRRDKRTQVLWGIADFVCRFGRRPEGMWLAETAVDIETLDILAEHGLSYTILAQSQAQKVRPLDGKKWRDVGGGRIDPKTPYLCRLPSGRSLALFFYDGPISQDMAFAGLLSNGEALAQRMASSFTNERSPQLVHVATDGETYGHHHRRGEMALAYALRHIEQHRLAKLTVYGEYLEKYPPSNEVQIFENTSWSCAHGLERWRTHCGCNSGRTGWRQDWRGPLRTAFDHLRDRLAEHYESEAANLAHDPWALRDDYIHVILDRSSENVERFLSNHATHPFSSEEKVKTLRLLEMQRHALLMYTSCGWFFDEISGLETTQVMQYAARAIQLAEKSSGLLLEPELLEMLRQTPSNIPEHAHGAEVYEKFVKPAMVDLLRVGAHYAVSSLFEEYEEKQRIFCYSAEREIFERRTAGRQKLATGKAVLRSEITCAEKSITFAVLHLGEHNLIGGVREFRGAVEFNAMQSEIHQAFDRGDLPEIIRGMDRHFETHSYSLMRLFRDEQRKIVNYVMADTMRDVENSFRMIYEHNYPLMIALREMEIPLPKALAIPAEYTVKARLRRLFESEVLDLQRLREIVEEMAQWSFESDEELIGLTVSRKISEKMRRFADEPANFGFLREIEGALRILSAPMIKLDLMESQNQHFRIARTNFMEFQELANRGDADAAEWIRHFDLLGTYLQIRSA